MLKQVRSTYRIQLNPSFGFNNLGTIVRYLKDLGISHVYASPIFEARRGSTHGYDIVDPACINPEIGTREEFERLVKKLHDLGIGWIQDVVPNHLAYDGKNRMLMDIFENGSLSKYFTFFDIFWNHPYENMQHKLLAPFLGAPYGECLENGEIALRYGEQGFSIAYFGLSFPIKIESYYDILNWRIGELRESLGPEHADYIKFLGILYVLNSLPEDEQRREERYAHILFIKKMLHEVYAENREIRDHIDRNLIEYNGIRGDTSSYAKIDTLLDSQYFRLAYWRVANQEINYKRFFNINELISVRVHDEEVFRETHKLVIELLRAELIDGLRIDHIDGLYDPEEYLGRLRDISDTMYIAVEKILEPDEEIPVRWPVQGTTGYDFLNYMNGLFCRKNLQREWTALYREIAENGEGFMELVFQKKRLIIDRQLTGDLDNLAHLLKLIANRYRHGRDITLHGLRQAMVGILTFFPVYRTYVRSMTISEHDQRIITEAVKKAQAASPHYALEISFIEKLFLSDFYDELTPVERDICSDFVMKFQRLTGPLMAKGFEDTVLYLYNRLISLNEVGGDPIAFGVSLHQFHTFNRNRAEQLPDSMNASATHDTKRGEDVRARINVLSEIPKEWKKYIRRWQTANKKYKRLVGEKTVPDSNEEYFIYQTVVGSYPLYEEERETFIDRMEAYMVKVLREAKVHSFWSEPNVAYEEAVGSFIRDIFSPSRSNVFLKEFLAFQKRIAKCGMVNSLSQVLLKMISPGVPDTYQGTELWDLSLVDPDNRRPVDFNSRMSYLDEIRKLDSETRIDYLKETLQHWEDGRIKLYIVQRALTLRNELTNVCRRGDYVPLRVFGKYKNHIVAFARTNAAHAVVCIVARWVSGFMEEGRLPLGKRCWEDTAVELPGRVEQHWTNRLTDERWKTDSRKKIRVAQLFSHIPIALLTGEITL